MMKVKQVGIFFLAGFALAAFGKGSWEERQEQAEQKTTDALEKYPDIRSDQFVVKTITLPEGGTLPLDLRIERPKTGGPFPVVFFVHGGAWINGSKEQFTSQSFELAQHGIAGVRIEYRWRSQGGVFTNVIGDVLDAIDFIRKRADELNIDFTRVGLAGGSAGGHLSAIAAQLTPECIVYDGYNGLYDVLDIGDGRFGRSSFIGESAEEKKAASALHILRDNPPDTILYHGTADTTIDIDQSRRFAAAIRAKGGQAEVLEYEGAEHSFFNKEPYLTVTTKAQLDHDLYVFGLSKNKPDPKNYRVEAKEKPDAAVFSLIGTWCDESDPSRTFIFKEDGSLKSPAGVDLQWKESDGQYSLIWTGGRSGKIQQVDGRTIKIGKAVYMKKED